MLKFSSSFYLLILLLAMACNNSPQDSLLVGQWQGAILLEEGDSVEIDPSVIQMGFDEKQGYAYTSTLNYQEAGTYYLDNQYLYTTDTLNQASTEKAVEVVLLSPDSLHLRMEEAGQERLLKLIRVQQ